MWHSTSFRKVFPTRKLYLLGQLALFACWSVNEKSLREFIRLFQVFLMTSYF